MGSLIMDAKAHTYRSVTQLVHSYLHMHVNRMIRTAQRMHELVLYDLLRRHYDAVLARGQAGSRRARSLPIGNGSRSLL
jgi:hypothetical protein